MNLDDFQKTWQAQNLAGKAALNPDLLLKEVRRNEQNFRATILRRDILETGGCLVMASGFLVWGLHWEWWSLDLLSLGCLLVAIFFLADRRWQRSKQPVKNDSLQSCIESSLFQVKHQIWLLKNIIWWYLLPVIIGVACVTGQMIWSFRGMGADTMMINASVFVLTYGFTYGFVYWMNQRAVKIQLEPRRKELEALLDSLK